MTHPLKRAIWIAIILIVLFPALQSCKEKDEELPPLHKETEFVKETMELWYFWNDKMPNNIDIKKEADPAAYFNKLLYKDIDKWSFISDDYESLNNMLNGTEYSMGYSLSPFLISKGANDVFAFIDYVEPNSAASKAKLKRGDIIYKINNTTLNINNYYNLVSLNQYSVTLGKFNESKILQQVGDTKELIATTLHNNTVFLDTIYTKGTKKIGYMVYNSFTKDKENSLDRALAEFKTNNINDLIIDLRYNGGGFDSLAIALASSIGPSSNVGKVMYNTTCNAKFTSLVKKYEPEMYANFTRKFESSKNHLNMNRLYVLTSENTASASEMILYTLQPYISVIQIGTQTHGKYYAMAVMPFPDENKGPWVMAPIFSRMDNISNTVDYSQGLKPQFEMDDDFEHQLGDTEEALLAKAISEITGTTTKSTTLRTSNEFKALEGAKQKLSPFKFELITK